MGLLRILCFSGSRLSRKLKPLAREVEALKLFGQDLHDLQDLGRVGENSWLARQLVRQSLRGGGSLGEGGNG